MSQSRTLITGGASGLGAEIAARCDARGHRVVVIDQREADVETVIADISSVEQTVAAVEEALARLDGLDNLVTCAGINRPGATTELDPALVARIIDINLTGTMITTITALDALLASTGRAVFIGSTLTRRGHGGQVAYAASKHGLTGFVKSLGYEFRGRLGLTMVEPGAMDTPLFDGRPPEWDPPQSIKMSPGTVADAVMFALDQPPNVSVRELLITHLNAPDWP